RQLPQIRGHRRERVGRREPPRAAVLPEVDQDGAPIRPRGDHPTGDGAPVPPHAVDAVEKEEPPLGLRARGRDSLVCKHSVRQPVNLRFFPTAGQERDPSRPRRTDRLPGPCAPGPPPQTPGMPGPGRSPPSLQHPRPEGQSHASSRCPPRHPRLPCPTPNRSKPLPTDRSMTDEAFRFATLAIHAGQEPEPTTGAIMQPVFQTSTYVQEGLGKPRQGHEYARVTNPTRSALEANVAALEGGKHGIAFSSGLAATEAIVKRLSAGDHVVSEENTYGGTTRLFTQVLS